MKQTVGIVLWMALMGAPLAAQRPMTPSDYQPPPAPTAQPAPQAPTAGDEARARYKAAKEKAKDPYNGKPLGPIGLMPLQLLYFASLGGPPAVAPTVNDELLFAAINTGVVGAWRVEDGASVWSVPNLAVVQPLAIDGTRLYAVLDGEVTAIDIQTGKSLWRVPSGGKVSAAPVAKAGWLILGLETGEVHAVRGETGELVWQLKLGATVKTKPVIVGDRLYVVPRNNQLVAIDLVSGRALWNQELEGPVSGLAAQEQRVFIGTDRMFMGLDHAGHLKWKRHIGSGVIGDPSVDAENVYVAFSDNTLMAFGANKGELLWRAPLTYRPTSGPIRARDTLLLTGSPLIIHGFDVKDGKPAPDYAMPGDPIRFLVGAPMFVRGRTFFQDTVITMMAHGWIGTARQIGPGTLSPFTDPGVVCPPLSLPGAEPSPTASAPSTPPKA